MTIEEKKEIEYLRKENRRLKRIIKILLEEKEPSESTSVQPTTYNPFAPWSNCCASINYPDGFNPQANWCKARIDQYGYIPNPDLWRSLNG